MAEFNAEIFGRYPAVRAVSLALASAVCAYSLLRMARPRAAHDRILFGGLAGITALEIVGMAVSWRRYAIDPATDSTRSS